MVQTAKGLVPLPVARLAVLEVGVLEKRSKIGPGGQCYGGEDVETGNTCGHVTGTVSTTI